MKRNSRRWTGVAARQHENHSEKTYALFIEFGSKTAHERFEAKLAAADTYCVGGC